MENTGIEYLNRRERRWFVLKRPRRDINGGSETEVTVTSKRQAKVERAKRRKEKRRLHPLGAQSETQERERWVLLKIPQEQKTYRILETGWIAQAEVRFECPNSILDNLVRVCAESAAVPRRRDAEAVICNSTRVGIPTTVCTVPVLGAIQSRKQVSGLHRATPTCRQGLSTCNGVNPSLNVRVRTSGERC